MERINVLSDGLVATVTLNRPDVHNAFDETLIRELTAAIHKLSDDETTRVVVLTGAGKSFCAGADLNWMSRVANYSFEQNLDDSWELQRMFVAIHGSPKVTIARVNGAAIGGGAGLVAACDIAVASSSVTFGFSEVRLGLVPAVIGPYVLEKIGLSAARALFVTGERFGSEHALRIGLIHEIAKEDQLDAAVNRKIDDVLASGPHAVAAAKRLLSKIALSSPAEAASLTVEMIAALRISPEGQAGIHAFLDKRKAAWIPNERGLPWLKGLLP